MDYDEVVTTRRSVHDYADETVDRETVEAIFEEVRYAPSGYNLQPWEFLVLTDDEDRERLQEVAGGQEHVTDASAAVVVLGNEDPTAHVDRVLDDWVEKDYLPDEDAKEAVRENVEGMADMAEDERRVWTTRSTSLAAMALMNAAWSHGVASCPMEGFDAEALVEEFDIGEGYEPVMLVTLGYPADDADDVENARKFRRPVDEIVHFGEFDPVADGEGEQAATTPATGDD
ncbi:nitroreductase family protein [Halobium salinum]|uniref:Nitroreductase family protein n=1 Tax=Halobium salinum TaxID=1364940 RepID=A0ABD5P9Q4_9EURY|nr:nitroreductase family protein [Halobium salinum]